MNQADTAPREFWNLLNGTLNGTLSDVEVERLESYLDGDFGLQMLFRNYCQLHVNLESETRAQRVIDQLNVGRRAPGSIRRQGTLSAAVDLRADKPAARRRSKYGWMGIVACAATLACILLTLLVQQQGSQLAGVPSKAPVEELSKAGQSLDVITVRLASDESRYLSIGDIGNIHIQGPAYLELFGTSRAVLHEGRIKVRITDPRGHGFVVETLQGNVTDLGTEFGVDVDKGANTGVVVFEGSVDLAVPREGDQGMRVQRLVQGEGLNASGGRTGRIMAIVTGKVSTFSQPGSARPQGAQQPIIVDVFDNIPPSDLRKFYEIVPGGMQEDALAYVDRPEHDWSGVDDRGIPRYLLGADYVKPFNSDKTRSDVKISVTLACPSRLFIFADDRVKPPQWLLDGFKDTGDDIGHDVGLYELNGEKFHRLKRGKGPGKSIDSGCSIWEQVVRQPGTIELGPNSGSSDLTAMYGIAAIPLDAPLTGEDVKSKADQASGIGEKR